MRGLIERNTITLLNNYDQDSLIDLPSEKWLGRWARSEEILLSGLWNVNHVIDDYDERFLAVLEGIIK